jgi:hypothetical protein
MYSTPQTTRGILTSASATDAAGLKCSVPPEEGTDVFQVGALQGIVLWMQSCPGETWL